MAEPAVPKKGDPVVPKNYSVYSIQTVYSLYEDKVGG